MAVTWAQFKAGIRQEESGGDYHVVNSIGAVGAYQVMKGNVPSWTKRALGYSMTWQQFRDSPAAQDRVADVILGGYYKQYGPEGAAAMWFSGQPNPNKVGSDGSTTIRSYVNNVMSLSGQQPSSGSSGSSGSSAAASPGETRMTPSETAESYGFVQALFNANPELKKLFGQAVKGQWTSQKFQASLRDTKWFKTHSQTERDYLTLQYGDPATAKLKLAQAVTRAKTLAASLGSGVSSQAISTAAYNIVAKGWTNQDAQYYLGQYITFKNDGTGGSAGQALDTLHQFSYSMGIKNSDKWYQDFARNIARGSSTAEDAESAIRKQAMSLFPQWQKQIEGGQTVADIANPYMQSMSQILEIPPGSVNLFDPTIKKALQYKDPKSGQNTAQPIWSFETTLRSDPRWKSTKNAQDSMMQAAHQVLSDFGVRY